MYELKEGESVLLCDNTADQSSIRAVKIVKIADEQGILTAKVKAAKLESFWVYVSALYPLSYEQELRELVAERAKLKQAFDDSLSLVYKLRNKIDFKLTD